MTGNFYTSRCSGRSSETRTMNGPSEVERAMLALDPSRPFEFKGSTTGSVFAVEWSFRKAYLVPTPLEKDYPLRCTESSEWITATTVVIKHLPDETTRDSLAALLVCEGFGGLFNMIYIPYDYSDWAPYAYAFCNMKTHENARELKQTLHGRTWWKDTEKVCEVRFATTQGYDANVKRYRNMPCNHASIRNQFGPMLYDRFAQPFPIQPSQYIVPPKAKNTSSRRHGDRSSHGCSLKANIVAVLRDVSEEDSRSQMEGGLSEAETMAVEDSASDADGMPRRASEAIEESDEDSASDMDTMPRSQSEPALALVF